MIARCNLFRSCTWLSFLQVTVVLTYNRLCMQNKTLKEAECFTDYGSDVSLECHSSTALVWKKDGENLVEGQQFNPSLEDTEKLEIIKKFDNHTKFLKINNVSHSDVGKYCCETVHDGKPVEFCYSVSLFAIVDQLSNGSLFCNISGISSYSDILEWEHRSFEGQHLRYLNGSKNGILNIGISSEDEIYKLDGIYICKIDDVTNDLNYSYTGLNDFKFKGTPSCIQNHEPNYGTEGKAAHLKVNVYSQNITRIEWRKEGNSLLINDTNRYHTTSSESKILVAIYGVPVNLEVYSVELKITNLTDNDIGVFYTVTVSNNYGNTNCTTGLKRGNVPDPPKDISIRPFNSGFKIMFKESFNGGFPQTIYANYRCKETSNWRTATARNQNVIYVSDLPPGSVFEVNMHAENLMGKSNYTETIRIRTYKKDSLRAVQLYVLICFVFLVIILLTSALFGRIKKGLKGESTNVKKKRRPEERHNDEQNNRLTVKYSKRNEDILEEVVLSTQTSGKRFIIK